MRGHTFWQVCPLQNVSMISRKRHNDEAQPSLGIGHPRNLTKVFTGHPVNSQRSKTSSGGQRRLISLRGCADWSESSLDAHAISLEMLCPGWLHASSFSKTLNETRTVVECKFYYQINPRRQISCAIVEINTEFTFFFRKFKSSAVFSFVNLLSALKGPSL